jgi:EAL domain-containing protein (putative c-di-GMP-specific phosphodiesterase class I)
MEDQDANLAALRALNEVGIRLAVDDFGTGYAALSYFRRCPIDALKVDRDYVAGLGRNPEDETIVRAVVNFAKTMGLRVTAEGIETAEQLAQVRALGCDLGQGYYFARPLPGEALVRLLEVGVAIADPGAGQMQVPTPIGPRSPAGAKRASAGR